MGFKIFGATLTNDTSDMHAMDLANYKLPFPWRPVEFYNPNYSIIIFPFIAGSLTGKAVHMTALNFHTKLLLFQYVGVDNRNTILVGLLSTPYSLCCLGD